MADLSNGSRGYAVVTLLQIKIYNKSRLEEQDGHKDERVRVERPAECLIDAPPPCPGLDCEYDLEDRETK